MEKKAGGSEQICRRKIRSRKTKKEEEKLKLKNTSGDGEGASCSATGVETRGSKARKKVTDQSLDGIQPPTTTTDIEYGSANVGTNTLITSNQMQKKEKQLLPDEQYCCRTDGKKWRCKNFRMSHGASGDDPSVPKTKYCEKHYNIRAKYRKKLPQKRSRDGGGAGCSTATGPLEIRPSKRRKTATEEEDETGEIQPATSDDDTCSAEIGTKRKKVQKSESSGDLISLTKIGEPVELEGLEHYKSKCFELSLELEKQKLELEKQKLELEKKNGEYTILQSKYAELETKKTPAEDVDTVKYWRNKCSDLESRVLEVENSTMPIDVNKPNTETRSGGRKDSRWPAYGRGNLHLPTETKNVEERNGRGCSEEERPSQYHLGMSYKRGSVNLVSDDEGVGKSEDSGCHGEILGNSEESGSHGEILGKSNEMKWKSDDDMASSFKDDIELCMKSMCALYRNEDEILRNSWWFAPEDKLRWTALAKFLMNGDCKGDLKKSVKDLEILDSTAVSDCKKLAKRYSPYLFDFYKNGTDPFIRSATTATDGDRTANLKSIKTVV